MTGPPSVNDLAALTGMSASLTSHHLRLLKAARLVRAERRGKFVHYSVHDHHVTSVLLDMMEHVAKMVLLVDWIKKHQIFLLEELFHISYKK